MTGSLKDIIILNNRNIIALNKPAAMPSVPDQTGDESLLDLASRYCRRKLFPVHRLDRPVSGLQLFAKKAEVQHYLAELMKTQGWQKEYLALVKHRPETDSGRLMHFIQRDGKRHKAIILDSGKENQQAISHFSYLFSLDHYHVVKLVLETGRFHQLRAQLAAIGSPVKGDVKYGARRKNPDRSIGLHSWHMRFALNPESKDILLEAPLPDEPIWQAVKDGLKNSDSMDLDL